MDEQSQSTIQPLIDAVISLWVWLGEFQTPEYLQWMNWTQPVAVFFLCIAIMLIFMTFLQIIWPTVERKGFLPISTTRGDRLFIGLLGAAFIHLGWIGFTDMPLYYGTAVAGLWFVAEMGWG